MQLGKHELSSSEQSREPGAPVNFFFTTELPPLGDF